MPLTIAERKHQMPHGAQREVATQCGVPEGYVSLVMSGAVHPKTAAARKRLRKVQNALARKLSRRRDEVFGGSDIADASEDHTTTALAS